MLEMIYFEMRISKFPERLTILRKRSLRSTLQRSPRKHLLFGLLIQFSEQVDADTLMMTECNGIYHERQKRMLCAVHVLNNLLQKNVFSKTSMDNICYNLSPDSMVNPHKNMFGLGNYDVNVVAAALQTQDLSLVWFDKRKNVRDLVLSRIRGLVLNIPTEFGIGILKLPFTGKHWFVIREVNGTFYNLDSKLPEPKPFDSETDVIEYVDSLLTSKNCELLIVVEQNVETDGSWIETKVDDTDLQKLDVSEEG